MQQDSQKSLCIFYELKDDSIHSKLNRHQHFCSKLLIDTFQSLWDCLNFFHMILLSS